VETAASTTEKSAFDKRDLRFSKRRYRRASRRHFVEEQSAGKSTARPEVSSHPDRGSNRAPPGTPMPPRRLGLQFVGQSFKSRPDDMQETSHPRKENPGPHCIPTQPARQQLSARAKRPSSQFRNQLSQHATW